MPPNAITEIERLRHLDGLMRYVVEHSRSSIAILDRDLRYIYVSQRFLDLYRVTDPDIIGKRHWEVFPDLPDKFKQVHLKALAGETLSNDQEIFPRGDGRVEFTRWECRPWYDLKGGVGGIILITEVITESVVQMNRLRQFNHIVSHNLRSHTANLIGLLNLLDAEAPGLVEHPYMELLRSTTTSLNQTITHLNEVLDVHLGRHEPLSPCHPASAITRALAGVSAQLEESGMQVDVEVPDTLQVMAVPAYLDSIVLNLITNALKYRDPQRPARLRIWNEPADNGRVALRFADNGLGIDLGKYGNDLFGLFQTFHDHPDAKGMGLYITRSQVEEMGGAISVDSEPGLGSVFAVMLPVSSAQKA